MQQAVMRGLQILPKKYRDTAFVRVFGLLKVPMLWSIKPTVEEMTDQKTVVRIPFIRRNKNHLGSMYFGVMCAAADLAGGVTAMKHIQESGKKISLSFKDFEADFVKRAEGTTYFENTQGEEIAEFVQKVIASGERENMSVVIKATTPSQFKDEAVANFKLTLSLKVKG